MLPLSAADMRRGAGGYITLYLVMILAALLTLYLVLIDGARLGAARMQMESVSRIAQNAALAEFHREMHSRYDLFLVDTSYGGPGGGNEILAQHLRNYMDSNCARKTALPLGSIRDWTSMRVQDVQVTEARYASKPTPELREALRDKREDQREENEEKEEREEEVTSEEYEAASEEPSEAENMVDRMESFQFLPILFQVFGDVDQLSDRRADAGDSLCGRDVHLGTGMMAANSHRYPKADEIIFDRYIYEKMGSCTKPSEDGQLCYQTEYILCGHDSDKRNLEETAARLLLIREASNCAYLFTGYSGGVLIFHQGSGERYNGSS